MTMVQTAADRDRVREWLEIRQPLERQIAPLGQVAMTALNPLPGERVLDIGCGIGGTPLALARAVGPSGGVVACDRIAAALDVAKRDPDTPEHITFLCADIESHAFEAQSFDAAFSRFGVMFFDAPVEALRNIGRALRPQGRLGFVCWRNIDDNEVDHFPLTAAADRLPKRLLAAARSSPWLSFSSEDPLRRTLVAAGFEEISIVARDEWVRFGDLRSTVDVCSRVGALGKILRENPEFRSEAVRALEQALKERDGPNGPALRAATWVVQARSKPQPYRSPR